METNPAKTPFTTAGMLQNPSIPSVNEQDTIPPVAAANVVFTVTFDASTIAPFATNVLPANNIFYLFNQFRTFCCVYIRLQRSRQKVRQFSKLFCSKGTVAKNDKCKQVQTSASKQNRHEKHWLQR